MRISYRTVKEWYNSYLTFQNLKKNSENLLGPDEKDLMWMPWIIFINIAYVELLNCATNKLYLMKP